MLVSETMKRVDKVIIYYTCKVSPFMIVFMGIYLGYLFGNLWNITHFQNNIIPNIIGSCVGFVLFGIIGRGAYLDLNDIKQESSEVKDGF